MGIIYKVRNKINGKLYIGQTIGPLNRRLLAHKNEAYNNPSKGCPFHLAIVKYGFNNFEAEVLEEVKTELLNEREIYWIDYYNSYRNGYNATLGGQGGRVYSAKDVLPYWNNGYGSLEISKLTGINIHTVSNLLLDGGITALELKERHYKKASDANRKYPYEVYLNYWNDGMTIKEISDILEINYQYISIGLKKMGISSEEIRKRGAESAGKKLGKRCALVDKNNRIITIFRNRHEAAEEVLGDRTRASAISRVCSGKINCTNGFIFRDLDEEDSVIVPKIKHRELKTAVYGISKKDPTDIVHYSSISEAARMEKIDRGSIGKCIAGSTKYSTVGGRIWRKESDIYE